MTDNETRAKKLVRGWMVSYRPDDPIDATADVLDDLQDRIADALTEKEEDAHYTGSSQDPCDGNKMTNEAKALEIVFLGNDCERSQDRIPTPIKRELVDRIAAALRQKEIETLEWALYATKDPPEPEMRARLAALRREAGREKP